MSKFKLLLIQSAGVLALFVAFMLLHPSRAHAATYCNSPGQWVSADVYVQVLNPDGSINHLSNNFDFNVQTTDPSGFFHFNTYAASFWDQSILDPNGTALGANVNIAARPGNVHGCYLGLPAYDFTDGTNGNDVLNCLWGVDHAHSVGFNFHGQAVHDTNGLTGHWVRQDVGISPTASGFLGATSDLNKQQYTIILQYQLDNLPPPPPPAPTVSLKLTSNGVDNPSVIEVGDPIQLTWTPKDASSCQASDGWSGRKSATAGKHTESRTAPPYSNDSAVAGNKKYTIICSGSGGDSNPATVTVTVAAKPYLRVYGGDVQAGMSTSTGGSCVSNTNTNAGIVTYNKDSAGSYAGAGGQYLAIAPNAIYQFASGALRTSLPTAGYSLSPKNTAPWGGSFGTGGLSCGEDYYGNPANTSPQIGPYTVAGRTVGVGTHPTLYVNGDAIITGDIAYQNSGTGWSAITDIPSFYLIVKGNMYITNNVGQLDGVYIAQDDGSGTKGRIYTCASQAPPYVYPATSLYDNCRKQLTINGAFIANQVKFLRTNGTLKNAKTDHSADSNIAEIFNYTPELWLSQPNLFPSTTSGYDSITSLPPVL